MERVCLYDKKETGEVIIIPDEGYSKGIYNKGAKLYKKYNCPIIISGADRNPYKQKASGLKKYLEKTITPIQINEQIFRIIELGVNSDDIFYEDKSNNTKENAVNSLNLIISDFPKVQKIHLVGSLEGMPRRYLTFKKTVEETKKEMKIILYPSYDLFPLHLSFYRFLLIPSEGLRIIRYRKKGDL